MKNTKNNYPPVNPYNSKDDYDDDNIPEIDLPHPADIIPDEVPRHDGPGGE